MWALLPDTHAPEVLRTGKPVLAQVVRAQGVPAVTNYIPRLDANGKVIGVFIYVIVYGKQNVDDVSARLSELSREVEFYKKELSRIRGARYSMDNIIGKSDAIQRLKAVSYTHLQRLAQKGGVVVNEIVESLAAHGKASHRPAWVERLAAVVCCAAAQQLHAGVG